MQRILRSSLFLLVLFIPVVLSAQAPFRIRIYGRVIDAVTKEPLHFANVFITNSTMGAASDENGTFSIVNVPAGTYELVASMIGYDLDTREIRITEPNDQNFLFKLYPKALEAPGLAVEAPIPHEWRGHLRTFKSQFIGMSRNARDCEIINPENLDFNFEPRQQVLKATASKPLEIENRALGYRIYFLLERFIYRSDGSISYSGRPRYEKLTPTNDKEKETWEKNRLMTFNGSFRHFIYAAANNKNLAREGFVVSSIENIGIGDENIYIYSLKSGDLIEDGETDMEKKFSFPHYLKVVYRNEEEPREFTQNPASQQTSFILLKHGKFVEVNTSGHVRNPYALETYGFWAWERFADALPLDYMPDKMQE